MAGSEMETERLVRQARHAARRLQLVALLAAACDLAFGAAYAFASDLEVWETTLFVAIFAVAMTSWVMAVFAESWTLRASRRLA